MLYTWEAKYVILYSDKYMLHIDYSIYRNYMVCCFTSFGRMELEFLLCTRILITVVMPVLVTIKLLVKTQNPSDLSLKTDGGDLDEMLLCQVHGLKCYLRRKCSFRPKCRWLSY